MAKIIKRNGSIDDFDINNIVKAVTKAFVALDKPFGEVPLIIGLEVQRIIFESNKIPNVDTVQDLVEREILKYDHDVGKAYITYRYEHDKKRDSHKAFIRDINNLVTLSDKSIINENANKDAKVFPVQRDLMAGIISKHLARESILPKHIVKAHDSGDIHYHDLDYSPFLPMTNCCLVDLTTLLRDGFKLGNAQIESPKSIGVACAVMAQITAQVASHQYGGTTFANIDKVLAPYASLSWNKHLKIAKDYGINEPERFATTRTLKEIYDGIQAYEYEINTLFTTNG